MSETRNNGLMAEEMTDVRPPVKKKNHLFLKLCISLAILLLVMTVGLMTYVYLTADSSFKTMRSEALQLVKGVTAVSFQQHSASTFYDDQGEILSKAKTDKAVSYVTGDQIPQSIKEIIVTVEDRRFMKHHGVDYLGLASVGVEFVKNGFEITRGASTITQQLARNVFLTHQVSLERKFKEMVIARELEKKFSKDQILEFYLNNIYFANGAYGIESAAQTYFNKGCQELSMNEQIFLLGIPSNPTLYDPIKHMDQAIYRKNLMVDILAKRSYITEGTQARLKREVITLNPQTVIPQQDYLQSYANYCATETLMGLDGFIFQNRFTSDQAEKNYRTAYDEAYSNAYDQLKRSGYRIYTTLDTQQQPQLQQILDKELKGFTEKDKAGTYMLQASACIIDNKTGMVVNIIGGRDQSNYMSLNRAFQSYRQPGSTIKPLVVYGPLMDDSKYGPRTMLGNQHTEGGPSNLDEQYSNAMSMEQALAYSKNVPAWNAMEVVGPAKAMSYLYKMDFRRIDRRDEAARATALGGFTYGVNTLEMASAYSTFSRDGRFIQPTCISRMESADGQIIYTNPQVAVEVYSKRSSRLMTDMLQNVMRSGTGTRVQLKARPCAGKTGTTNDLKDGWFVGYTPQYTTAVWVGYDSPRTVKGMQGGTYPGRIWKGMMDMIHQGLPVQEFAASDRGDQGGGSIHVTAAPETPTVPTDEQLTDAGTLNADGTTKPDGTATEKPTTEKRIPGAEPSTEKPTVPKEPATSGDSNMPKQPEAQEN